MSALGYKQTSSRPKLKSAIPPKADVAEDSPQSPVLSSRPGESHPQALLEPCVNLSAHTAPDVRPFP